MQTKQRMGSWLHFSDRMCLSNDFLRMAILNIYRGKNTMYHWEQDSYSCSDLPKALSSQRHFHALTTTTPSWNAEVEPCLQSFCQRQELTHLVWLRSSAHFLGREPDTKSSKALRLILWKWKTKRKFYKNTLYFYIWRINAHFKKCF